MTARPGEAGAPLPAGQRPPRRRARYKPIVAAVAIAGPVLALLVLDAATLVWAFVSPTSTCWMKSGIEAGIKQLSPFEIHLLLFTATMQVWVPVILLAIVLFWYLEWIRVRELAAVAAGCVAGLFVAGVEFGWMVELYRGQYQLACG